MLNVLRKLWSDQDIWIRSFIQGKDTESDDLQAVAVELLRNAEQLANVLRQFYGDETANSFDRLLSYHVFITFQVIDAIKALNNSVNGGTMPPTTLLNFYPR